MLLIEGIGGVMVPLDDRRTVLDWMSLLRIPVVLVAGSYVGTISHTLTALEVLARRNLDIAAVVVSESETAPPRSRTPSPRCAVCRFDRHGRPAAARAGTDDHPAFADLAGLF